MQSSGLLAQHRTNDVSMETKPKRMAFLVASSVARIGARAQNS
jgi:hypothetical protein